MVLILACMPKKLENKLKQSLSITFLGMCLRNVSKEASRQTLLELVCKLLGYTN